MKVTFKITGALMSAVRRDLARPHAFAHERVGFISAGLADVGTDVVALARAYRPVEDEDYLQDPSVGAMMGREAIRKALQWSLQHGHAVFHVHTHGGEEVPSFSCVDIRENKKFVPDFFKVAPQNAHGALVLSDVSGRGQIWLARDRDPDPVDRFVVVGPALHSWRPT